MLTLMTSSLNDHPVAVHPGLDRIVYTSSQMAAPETIRLTSEAFGDHEPIPARFTDDGEKISPPLTFDNVPPDAKSLALIVEDADSETTSPICHALVWDIDPRGKGLDEAALDANSVGDRGDGPVMGRNSLLALGWLPPGPPLGQGPHRYAMQLFALDYRPNIAEGSLRLPIVKALQGHILAKGILIGTYERV